MTSPIDVAFIKRELAARPDVLAGMSPSEQEAVADTIVRLDDDRYKDDAYVWARERVLTLDEASAEIVPFPDWALIEDLFWAMEHIRKLAIPKSRRMMVSWSVATKVLHKIRYFKNVMGIIQSQVQEKSAYLIEKRMKFIEDNLLAPYRRPYSMNRAEWTMTYSSTGSWVKGVAQGPDVFRAYTPSIVVMDEVEHMDKGHESFVAALPFAEKKAQIILIGTSNGPHGVLAGMAREFGFERF